ncbi:MAG: hypothetical protein ACKO63_02645, partial [Nodosilinea sp.]
QLQNNQNNAASQRVMQKLGMRYAKTMQYNGTEVLYYLLSREAFRRNHVQPDPTELDLLITSL